MFEDTQKLQNRAKQASKVQMSVIETWTLTARLLIFS